MTESKKRRLEWESNSTILVPIHSPFWAYVNRVMARPMT